MTEGCTRGPWQVTGDNFDVCGMVQWVGEISSENNDPYRGTIARIQSCEHIGGITRKEAEANARLIAAAPDLLAFAKAYDAYMAAHYSGPDSHALHPDAANNWRMCRAAIARAEGSAV